MQMPASIQKTGVTVMLPVQKIIRIRCEDNGQENGSMNPVVFFF